MNNTLISRLEGLSARFEEVSTLITDPSIISDMKRYVKLNKEYSELERIITKRNEYQRLLQNLAEAKEILDSENDPEMREMAKLEIDAIEPKIEPLEEEIKLLLIPADPEMLKTVLSKFVVVLEATKPLFLQAICFVCILNSVKIKAGKWLFPILMKEQLVVTRKLYLQLLAKAFMAF